MQLFQQQLGLRKTKIKIIYQIGLREDSQKFSRVVRILISNSPTFKSFSPPNNFDKHGNYNMGITEQLIFPEIDYDSVEQRRGFNITIVTTAKTPAEGRFLLTQLGFPFAKNQ